MFEKLYMKTLTLILTILVLSSCKDKVTSKSETIDKAKTIEEQTLDGLWELERVNDTVFNINQVYNYSARQPTISFNMSKEQISGYSGCNGFGGNSKFTENQILLTEPVTATQIGCGTNKWETDYFNRLLEIKEYSIENDRLTITGNDKRTMSFKRIILHPLEKNSWILEKVNDTIFDMKKEYGNDPQPVITFNLWHSTVGGWDGCNNFGLEIVKLNESSYESGGLASNTRGCYKGWPEIFFGVLGDNKEFVIENDRLTLTNSKGNNLTFRKSE